MTTTTETDQSTDTMLEAVNAPLVAQDAAQALLATVAPLVPRIAEYTDYAAALVVNNAEDAKAAAERAKAIRADITLVETTLEPHTQEASRRHKLLTGFRARFTDPFTAAGKLIKAKVTKWEDDERAKAEAERRRLQAEADERARREREKQEQAAAEARRKEEEARRAADEARAKAEAAQGEERRRLEAEADKRDREANAAAAKAEKREDAAQQVAAPVVKIVAPKSGIRARTDVTVEILDIVAFVQAAAANPMLCGYIDQPSLAAALKKAKASNPMFNVPGVMFGERRV